MAEITNPKIKNFKEKFGSLPIRADEISAKRFIEENNLGEYDSFVSKNDNRFSNDYGHLYNYYLSGQTYVDYWLNTGITYEWRTEFGYYPTINSINYT